MFSLFQNVQDFVNFLRSDIDVTVAVLILLALSILVYFVVAALTKRFFSRFNLESSDGTSLKDALSTYGIPRYAGAFAAI